MELHCVKAIETSGYADDIRQLLVLADREFIPPLSARSSATQAELSGYNCVPDGIRAYYDTIAVQPAVVALEEGNCVGFMAFKEDYTCAHISDLPNLYVSTCTVHPEARGKGLMGRFYRELIRLFPKKHIFTRTWHTNYAHLHVLESLGFREHARLPNHRGEGLDTVYFCRNA